MEPELLIPARWSLRSRAGGDERLPVLNNEEASRQEFTLIQIRQELLSKEEEEIPSEPPAGTGKPRLVHIPGGMFRLQIKQKIQTGDGDGEGKEQEDELNIPSGTLASPGTIISQQILLHSNQHPLGIKADLWVPVFHL